MAVDPSCITIVEADLGCDAHRRAVTELVDAYAADPMGRGARLPEDVLRRLVPGLREQPGSLILLAYVEDRPVGIAVCFRGYSTFAARPLINIHDLSVVAEYRGRGIGKRLLQAVEHKARELGCCKVTLEVQERNFRARRAYEAAGFAQSVHAQEAGGALFMTKSVE
jgi:GNAT superfamily N-acetyltransferase